MFWTKIKKKLIFLRVSINSRSSQKIALQAKKIALHTHYCRPQIPRFAAKTLVPRLANDYVIISFGGKRFSYEAISNERIPDTDYSAKQVPTAEVEHSILPLTCRNVSAISSLGTVFLSWILLTLLAALPCLFALQETGSTCNKFLGTGV